MGRVMEKKPDRKWVEQQLNKLAAKVQGACRMQAIDAPSFIPLWRSIIVQEIASKEQLAKWNLQQRSCVADFVTYDREEYWQIYLASEQPVLVEFSYRYMPGKRHLLITRNGNDMVCRFFKYGLLHHDQDLPAEWRLYDQGTSSASYRITLGYFHEGKLHRYGMPALYDILVNEEDETQDSYSNRISLEASYWHFGQMDTRMHPLCSDTDYAGLSELDSLRMKRVSAITCQNQVPSNLSSTAAYSAVAKGDDLLHHSLVI